MRTSTELRWVADGLTEENSNDDTFEYNAEYQVLICKIHKQAVRSLETHLRALHILGKKRRVPLLEKYSSCLLLPPKDVKVPEHRGLPISALGEPLDGILCDDCNYVTVSKVGMQKHCKIHDWWWSKRDPIHWTNVKVQTFFGTGFQKYFIVNEARK